MMVDEGKRNSKIKPTMLYEGAKTTNTNSNKLMNEDMNMIVQNNVDYEVDEEFLKFKNMPNKVVELNWL